jgi:hypothetical protein
MALIGPQRGVRASFGPSARPGWGFAPVRMTPNTITIAEARRRLKTLKANVRNNATRLLKEAGEILADEWRENIADQGWGPDGGVALEGDTELLEEFRERGLDVAETESGSTGRYYRSIAVEVDSELEVHVGSTIPRPSGRGLRRWSYPEILEFGSSNMAARPTLRPAIDSAGPAMIRRTQQLHGTLLKRFLMDGAPM